MPDLPLWAITSRELEPLWNQPGICSNCGEWLRYGPGYKCLNRFKFVELDGRVVVEMYD